MSSVKQFYYFLVYVSFQRFGSIFNSLWNCIFIIIDFRSDFSYWFVSLTIIGIILCIIFCFISVDSIRFVMLNDWPCVLKIISSLVGFSSLRLWAWSWGRGFHLLIRCFGELPLPRCATTSVVTLSFRKARVWGWIRCTRLGRHFVRLQFLNIKYLHKYSPNYTFKCFIYCS
jgi:hypothetical protein